MANTVAVALVMCVMCLTCLVVSSVSGFAIQRQHDDTESMITKETLQIKASRSADKRSVHRFAVHDLCRHYKGQKYFYQVLKTKFCKLRGMFVANLVMSMCKQRNEDLYKWVAELFDIDGDGHISYFEKHYYEFDS